MKESWENRVTEKCKKNTKQKNISGIFLGANLEKKSYRKEENNFMCRKSAFVNIKPFLK